ncbi:MAG: DNA adenine methylase [Planctomycetes bacterium]|nr:DNA adenine methylase [Planctomycetota bacterium]
MPPSLFPDAAAFRPLLKWPGGKSREWDEIAPRLPGAPEGAAPVRHFVDPFMGGLAPFVGTPFTGEAWLSDGHARLVALHRFVQAQDPAFLGAVESLGRRWESLAIAAQFLVPVFRTMVDTSRDGGRADAAAASCDVLAAAEVIGVPEAAEAITTCVLDKAFRVSQLERKHRVRFDAAQVDVHGETAVRAGFYTFVRQREGAAAGSGPQATADFLFVREFCYGSMFRHNADGVFNIPYGGTSYNAKSLLARHDQYRAPSTLAALARATFSSGDFEPFLDRLRPRLGPADFVFADPPYDSDFSSYGPDAFTQNDHARLAASLASLPCRWMLVIKETDFVRATYLGPAATSAGAREVHSFGKEYGYNVRGRNDRSARHLVITNYAAPGS